MKEWSDAALAAMEAGNAIAHGAVYIGCSPDPVAVWGGYGDLTLDDGITYTGVGDRGLVNSTSDALGSAATNTTLTLSGVEPVAMALFDAAVVRNAPVVLTRLVFDASGTVFLDSQVYVGGKVDQLLSELAQDGTYTISVIVEGATIGLGRAGGRIATGADQRLINPVDGSLDGVSTAPQLTLYWGGQKPAPAYVLPNTGAAMVAEAFHIIGR